MPCPVSTLKLSVKKLGRLPAHRPTQATQGRASHRQLPPSDRTRCGSRSARLVRVNVVRNAFGCEKLLDLLCRCLLIISRKRSEFRINHLQADRGIGADRLVLCEEAEVLAAATHASTAARESFEIFISPCRPPCCSAHFSAQSQSSTQSIDGVLIASRRKFPH